MRGVGGMSRNALALLCLRTLRALCDRFPARDAASGLLKVPPPRVRTELLAPENVALIAQAAPRTVDRSPPVTPIQRGFHRAMHCPFSPSERRLRLATADAAGGARRRCGRSNGGDRSRCLLRDLPPVPAGAPDGNPPPPPARSCSRRSSSRATRARSAACTKRASFSLHSRTRHAAAPTRPPAPAPPAGAPIAPRRVGATLTEARGARVRASTPSHAPSRRHTCARLPAPPATL
jgi:hypothetical protein